MNGANPGGGGAARSKTPCANCGEHPGTLQWSESATLHARGYFEMWCEGCALRAQIAHAEERATVLEGLRAKLAVWNRLHSEFVENEAKTRGAVRS